MSASLLANPSLALAPAPWQLSGQGYAFLMKMPEDVLANCPFTPTGLRKSRRSPLSLAMLVDYQSSAVGPYQELLFIPGTFEFGNGERQPSISRIYVSSQASVLNGRRNWGIPKDRCDFAVSLNDEGIDRAVLTADDGRRIAEMTLSSSGPALPLPAHWLPAAWRTLAQVWEGKVFTLAPSAQGKCRAAKVLDWHFDPELFPDLARGRCLAAVKIPQFTMTFPEPSVRSWHG